MPEIFVGDIGTRIIVDTGEDLTTATTLEIRYIKPSGESGVWEGTQVDEENTKMYYDTEANDINEAGDWQIQAYIELTSWQGHGEIATMPVVRPLDS